LERQLGLAPPAESRAVYEECVASLSPNPVVLGVPAGGDRIEADGITVLRFRGDRVIERGDRLHDI
jgi:hypothetical protein